MPIDSSIILYINLDKFFDKTGSGGGCFMDEKMTFCEDCRKDVTYSVEYVLMKGTLKGEQYSYNGKKATCAECGAEVYAAKIEDANLKALYDVYREKNGI